MPPINTEFYRHDGVWAVPGGGGGYLSPGHVLEVATANRLYTSIAAANAVAVPGDTVHVWPGLWAEQLVLQDQVQYYFEDGAVVEWDDAGSGNIGTIIAPGNIRSSIDGFGIFQDAGTNPVVLYVPSGGGGGQDQPQLFIKAKRLLNRVNGGLVVALAGGIVSIEGDMNAVGDGFLLSSGDPLSGLPIVRYRGDVTFQGVGIQANNTAQIEMWGSLVKVSPI